MDVLQVICRLISDHNDIQNYHNWIWIIREVPDGHSTEWAHPEITQMLACAMVILEDNNQSFVVPARFFDLESEDQLALLRVFATSAVLDDPRMSAALDVCVRGGFRRFGER